jgi:hypothetical protein
MITDEKKIKEAMHGIEPINMDTNSLFRFKTVSWGNYKPPAYIVELIFLNILGYSNYGELEKIKWHTYFQYKNIRFMIRDYKFGTWSIEAEEKNETNEKLSIEIRNKVIKASHYLDKILYKILKQDVQKGKFYLNNVYGKLSNICSFFNDKACAAIEDLQYHSDRKPKLDGLDVEPFNKWVNERFTIETAVSNYATAYIASNFALLEFLLDVIYAFECLNLNFFEFRNKSWDDRFKAVFPVQTNSELKKSYEELLHIKKEYRNPLSHGYANEVSLLVPFPNAGLVPLSYEFLSHKFYGAFGLISVENVRQIKAVFDTFMEYISNNEPWSFYLLFIEHGFPVPIEHKAISEVKKQMTDIESFEDYLKARSMYEDAVRNRDI